MASRQCPRNRAQSFSGEEGQWLFLSSLRGIKPVSCSKRNLTRHRSTEAVCRRGGKTKNRSRLSEVHLQDRLRVSPEPPASERRWPSWPGRSSDSGEVSDSKHSDKKKTTWLWNNSCWSCSPGFLLRWFYSKEKKNRTNTGADPINKKQTFMASKWLFLHFVFWSDNDRSGCWCGQAVVRPMRSDLERAAET